MAAPLFIVGQGLAGTLLGWACERAGLAFEVVDQGHESAASRVAAGIINPITGQRLVTSWRVEALLPLAWTTYRELECALGVPLIRAMRVRRLFRDERERRIFAEKKASGVLAPYAGEADAAGFWIEGAAQVETGVLIAAMRKRWEQSGRLMVRTVTAAECAERTTVLCLGAVVLEGGKRLPWRAAAGEILEITTDGLAPDVILNDGSWVLPTTPVRARVGATYRLGGEGEAEHSRQPLNAAARRLLGEVPFTSLGLESGWRATTADRHPLIGWLDGGVRVGVLTGLGSKGALLAPWAAEQWRNHLMTGANFDPTVDVRRFSGHPLVAI